VIFCRSRCIDAATFTFALEEKVFFSQNKSLPASTKSLDPAKELVIQMLQSVSCDELNSFK